MSVTVKELQIKAEGIKNFSDGAPEDLALLREKNAKLKYQLQHLNRALEKESDYEGPVIISKTLSCLFDYSVRRAFPELINYPRISVVPCTKPIKADYQCNAAMSLSKCLKEKSIVITPFEIAQKIVAHLLDSPAIKSADVVKAGFININLSKAFVGQQISRLLLEGVQPPRVEPKRVVVDYSSPNIAKDMHVGHLRSTIIGDSLANLCEFFGHSVIRLNHVGDWGTQFGMLLARLEEVHTDYDKTVPSIGDLVTFYKESKKLFDEDDEFKARSYQCVVNLQNGDEKCTMGWKLICDVSRKAFQDIYSLLVVKNLTERGESFYQSRMTELVQELKQKNILQEEEGLQLLYPPGCDIPLIIVKSDGGYTYDTSDLAALRQRLEEEKADWVFYVVDSGQTTHFKGIFSAAELLGWIDLTKHRVEHVGFGLVLGEDRKKLKSRSGDTIRLRELLSEGLTRSLESLKQKERDKVLSEKELCDAQHAIAIGCIKYADLSHSRVFDYVFSFDKMLEDKGNTAVYLLYAYTRIKSIARNANISLEKIKCCARDESQTLEHESEWKLAKSILRFHCVVLKVCDDLLLHSLCDYLYELSTSFTEFYSNCYCVEIIGDEYKINMQRLVLCEATALIMKKCFDILGIRSLERM